MHEVVLRVHPLERDSHPVCRHYEQAGRTSARASEQCFADSFTARYNISKLVHWEEYTEVKLAIAREKELKSWRRSKKVALIESRNPEWNDLAPNVDT